jgi:hypothetical protein
VKTEEHRDTNLMTTRGIADPKAVFSTPCHAMPDGRDSNPRDYSMINPRISEGQRIFYGGLGRPKNETDRQLIAAAQDFVRSGNLCRDGSRPPNTSNDQPGSSNLNA